MVESFSYTGINNIEIAGSSMSLLKSTDGMQLLSEDEMYDVSGGSVTLGTVIVVVGGCVIVCAVAGFVAGAAYEWWRRH